MAYRTMTFGVLPPKAEFKRAAGRHLYRIRWGVSDARTASGTAISGDGEYTADELYKGVKQLLRKWQRGDDDAGNIASGIMSTLGYEWV